MEFIVQLEEKLSSFLGWPAWALRTIIVLAACVVTTSLLQSFFSITVGPKEKSKCDAKVMTMEFRLFQLQFLGVYLTIMLADWLQGTNMYTLYSSYGVSVGTLFLTGFLSSAVFGTFLGVYVDAYGRRLGCIIFCLLEIVINLVEHIPNQPALMVGRVLGGMSTSLLFTAFESWMVSEHKKRGFDDAWLASTFSIASWGNGVVAIIAGLLAQVAADIGGDIGPFQLAIALTVLALIPILFWTENYGHSEEQNTSKSSSRSNSSSKSDNAQSSSSSSSSTPPGKSDSKSISIRDTASSNVSDNDVDDQGVTTRSGLKTRSPRKINTVVKARKVEREKDNDNEKEALLVAPDDQENHISMFASLQETLRIVIQHPSVFCLGLSQAFFEGAVYTFVFMWVPSMIRVVDGSLPTGLVFSAFMLSMTLGGMLFGILLPIFPGGAEGLCVFVYIVAAVAMLVPTLRFEFIYLLVSFLVLEAMVGMFNSCGAMLRSYYYPEGLHSSIMSVFRFPLNVLVVVGTKLSDSANEDVASLQFVFFVVAAMHAIAMLLQLVLIRYADDGKVKVNSDTSSSSRPKQE